MSSTEANMKRTDIKVGQIVTIRSYSGDVSKAKVVGLSDDGAVDIFRDDGHGNLWCHGCLAVGDEIVG